MQDQVKRPVKGCDFWPVAVKEREVCGGQEVRKPGCRQSLRQSLGMMAEDGLCILQMPLLHLAEGEVVGVHLSGGLDWFIENGDAAFGRQGDIRLVAGKGHDGRHGGERGKQALLLQAGALGLGKLVGGHDGRLEAGP